MERITVSIEDATKIELERLASEDNDRSVSKFAGVILDDSIKESNVMIKMGSTMYRRIRSLASSQKVTTEEMIKRIILNETQP